MGAGDGNGWIYKRTAAQRVNARAVVKKGVVKGSRLHCKQKNATGQATNNAKKSPGFATSQRMARQPFRTAPLVNAQRSQLGWGNDMPPNAAPRPHQVPLAVDLDGTLIRTDITWKSLVGLLRQNPLALLAVPFWWMRGRAFLKQQLAARVRVDAASLPYHAEFLAWLKEEKRAGRRLVLATASDIKMAAPVAQHVGLFDEVMASDGKTNLRGTNKLRALTAKFGERGFDYAGNSAVDLAVWRGTRAAVIVNARHGLALRAAKLTTVARIFP